MRILLAEDDKHLNQSLTRHLISKGYDVDTCLDGEDATMQNRTSMMSYYWTECFPI